MLGNHFGGTQWNSKVMWLMWNLVLVCLEMVLVSEQDRAQFAPNVPYTQKLVWTHPIQYLGDEALVEARFGPFVDSANLDTR
jgi:hypothetical protein